MSVRSATFWAATSQYIGFALQFASSVIIARYFLDPAEIGVFSVAFSAAAIVHGLQDFGLNRFIIGAKEVDDRLIRLTFSVSVAVALFITGTILLLARPVADFYRNEDLFAITAVIGASYIFIPFTVVPLALLQRNLDFKRYSFVEIGSNVINVTVMLGTAYYGYSSIALAFGVFANQFSRAVLAQCFNPILRIWPPTWRGTGEIFRYGMSSGFLSLTGSLSARAPDLIVGKALGEAALGLYGRATGLALQFRLLIGGPIASVIYPSLARARDRGDHLGEHYLRLTAALCAVTWAAMAGLAVASEPLILTLYGPKWAASAPVLVWVALAQVFFIAIPMQIEVGYLMGRWRRVIELTLIEALISVVLLGFAAQYGLRWVAISRVAHGAIWWVIHSIFVQRLVKFRWRDLFVVYLKTALAAFAAVIPLLLAYRFWVAPSAMTFAQLALLSLTGAGLWYVALHLVRHPSAADMGALALEPLRKLGLL
jgi:O-antigen/teichoic acid export membrane protein